MSNWLHRAQYIGQMRADAVRCKKCPDYCVLWDWAREPWNRPWFKRRSKKWGFYRYGDAPFKRRREST